MANFRSLTNQSGVTTQIQDANQIIVGAGITTAAGNLSISSTGGTTNLLDNTTLAANQALSSAGGTGSLDFSAASGIFKTTTGAVTVGPGAVTVSGATTFTAAGVALTVNNNVLISGNLTVTGTTFTTDSETVLIADNNLYLNNGYTVAAAQTGGLTVNYLPTATTTTVNAAYVAGVPAVSNPTVGTVGAATFAAGDLIQLSAATNNNGLFEVLSHAANVLTIRGIGVTATVEDFTQNQFVAGASDGATIVKVNVSVIRAGTDGNWEVGKGAVTPVTFSDLSTASTATLQSAYEAGNTITTSGAEGNLTFNGTEDFIVGGSVDLAFTSTGGFSWTSATGAIDLQTTGTMTLRGGGVSIFGDDTGAFNFNGTGALTTTGLTSASITPTGVITLTAGAASTWSTSSGALTLTSAAATTWSTAAGALTINGAAGVNIQGNGTNAVVVSAAANITLGNATTNTVAFVAQVGPVGNQNVTFVKELNHTISIDASTTASSGGGDMSVAGGDAAASATGLAAGAGGDVSLFSGAGGSASSTGNAGNGGTASLFGGEGGNTTGAGNAGQGGDVFIFGGGGGSTTGSTGDGGEGGDISIACGDGGAGTATEPAGGGGDLSIVAGNAGSAGGGAGNDGGNITMDAGNATGAGLDGSITIGTNNTRNVDIGSLANNSINLFGGVGTLATGTGALTITSATAATWKTSAGLLTIEGFAGIQLNGGAAASYVTVGVTANQIQVQAGRTLSTTGTGNINLPNNASARFQIEAVAVSANVTAANLGTLTAGPASNADALHTHAAIAVTNISVSGTTGEAIAAGNLVSWRDNTGAPGTPRIYLADADGAATLVNAVGFTPAAVGSGLAAAIYVSGEIAVPDASWTGGVPATTDVGKRVYMSTTPGLVTLTAPTASGNTTLKVGIVTVGGAGAVKVNIQIGESVLN